MAISEGQAKEERLTLGRNLAQVAPYSIVATGTVGVSAYPYQDHVANIDVPVSSLLRLRVYEQTFEAGTTDTTAVNCTQVVQSDEVYSGSYALRVSVPAGTTAYIETPSRPVSPYQRVTFTYAHKEDANITDIKLVVVWRRPAGGIISTDEFTLTPTTSWQVDSRTVTAPKQADSMTLRMQATAGTSDGTFYLDDVTIDLVGQIFRVDGAGNLKVSDDALDVSLSTRASELTLTGIRGVLESRLIKADTDSVIVTTGKIDVGNFPTEYPLPADQIPLPVTGAITVDGVSISSGVVDLVREIGSGRVEVANTPLPVTGLITVERVSISSGTIDTVRVLETGQVGVLNFPADYPLPSDQLTTLTTTGRVEVANVPLPTTGTTSVTNFPTEYPLPSGQVADLKIITTGQVGVLNFPAEYPLPSAQVNDLKVITTGQIGVVSYPNQAYVANLDVALSTRASESTLGALRDQVTGIREVISSLQPRYVSTGHVHVDNLPSDYPLPSGQLAVLTTTGTVKVAEMVDKERHVTSGRVEVANVPLPEFPYPQVLWIW